jgi:hypothetical protein
LGFQEEILMSMYVEEFKVGDEVEWDSPFDYFVKEENGIVISHGPVYITRRGIVTSVYDPGPERERLLKLYAEGKGYPLYGDWYNLKYVVVSEGKEYCPHPESHKIRLVKRGSL